MTRPGADARVEVVDLRERLVACGREVEGRRGGAHGLGCVVNEVGRVELDRVPVQHEQAVAVEHVARAQAREGLLNEQQQAALVWVLVPFVTGLSDLQRVKAAILEERLELQKKKVKCADTLLIAPGGKIIYRHSGVIDPLEVKKAIVDVIGRYFFKPASL